MVFARVTTAALLALSGVFLFSGTAFTEEASIARTKTPSPWTLTGEALTDAPILIGGRLALKTEDDLRLSLSVGYLPKSYVETINVAATSFDAYTEAGADVINEAIGDSLVVRLHGGWQLSDRFYVDTGYTFVGLGAGVSNQDLLTLVTGIEIPEGAGSENGVGKLEYELDCSMHMLDVELGWEWEPFDAPIILRAATGLTVTVFAQTEATPKFTPKNQEFVGGVTAFAEDYIDDILTTYILSPTVTLAVGYRFVD